MRTIFVWTLGLSALLGPSATLALAQGNVTVNCNATSDLQNRLGSVPVGSTVWITGNCDKGPYVVSQDLTIRGFGSDGANLSSPAGSAHVLIVQGATLRAEDFRITSNGATGILLHGAKLFANRLIVENGKIGVRVGVHSHATINDSTIRNNQIAGIEVAESSGAFVSGNTIEGNGLLGISVQMSSAATIQANVIRRNAFGTVVESNASAHLLANTIANSQVGLLVRRSGFVKAVAPANTFSTNGTDVQCFESGMIDAEAAPVGLPGGSLATDAKCQIFGSVF